MANTLNIIRGADKQFTLRITIQDPCDATAPGPPFDLSGASEIKCLLGTDSTIVPTPVNPLVLTMTGSQITILNAPQGSIQIFVSDINTKLLKVGDSQSFEIEIHIGSIISIVQFVAVLTVVDRVFP